VSGRGDAVSEEAIDRCFRLDGPLAGPEPGWRYVAGLDLGVSHDHAGAAFVGVNVEEQRVRVALVRGWRPSIETGEGKLEVDLEAVEGFCLSTGRAFDVGWFGYDPAAGGSFMAQRLRRQGVPMREMGFSTPSNLTAMAEAFVLSVKDGRLECYEDEEGRLRRDFGKFDLVEKLPSGYKLQAVSDEHGHADVGTALVICLPRAVEMLGWQAAALSPDDMLAYSDSEPLTQEEVDGMPDELREIYDMYDELELERGHARGF